MGEIEDLAMSVANAYEDNYFNTAKRAVFDAVLNRYLSVAGAIADDDLYENIVTLGRRHPEEFARFVDELRQSSLLP